MDNYIKMICTCGHDMFFHYPGSSLAGHGPWSKIKVCVWCQRVCIPHSNGSDFTELPTWTWGKGELKRLKKKSVVDAWYLYCSNILDVMVTANV